MTLLLTQVGNVTTVKNNIVANKWRNHVYKAVIYLIHVVINTVVLSMKNRFIFVVNRFKKNYVGNYLLMNS